jgi:hypothetical protein
MTKFFSAVVNFLFSIAKRLPPLEPLPSALRSAKVWVALTLGCSLGLLDWAFGPSHMSAESLAWVVGMPVVVSTLLVLATAGYFSQKGGDTIRPKALRVCAPLTRALGLKVTIGAAALVGISLSALTCWAFTRSSPALVSAMLAPMLAGLLLRVRAGLVPVDTKIARDLDAVGN